MKTSSRVASTASYDTYSGPCVTGKTIEVSFELESWKRSRKAAQVEEIINSLTKAMKEGPSLGVDPVTLAASFARRPNNLALGFISPLHLAIINCKFADNSLCALRQLHHDPSLRDAPDVLGSAPIHYALRFANTSFTHALLQAGAKVDATDMFGRGVVHYLVTWIPVRPVFVNLLERYSCAFDAQDNLGYTALAYAVLLRRSEWTCHLLSRKQLSFYIKDGKSTVLHLAATHEDPDMVRMLLEGGHPIDARDHLGRTALEIARKRGRSLTAGVLAYVSAKQAATTFLQTLAIENRKRKSPAV